MFSSNASQVSNDANYIEDVFSTWLYTGNGSTQTITNGIDLAGKGGLVWCKERPAPSNHYLIDTVRGVGNNLKSNTTDAQQAVGLNSFTSTGFTTNSFLNDTGSPYASWTFREQPKFFDVVTWSGNGVNGRNISHNLGSVPGCIIVKRTDTTSSWTVYHRGLGTVGDPQSYTLALNTTAAQDASSAWNDTAPTSTTFQVSSGAALNASGGSYVAYLFAHNAGGFGLTGTDNVISCGSYTSNGSTISVNLGWEPQWILIKRASNTGNWNVTDNMRGMTAATANASAPLFPNLSDAELDASSTNGPAINATGFTVPYSSSAFNYPSGETYIYIAIRRGPMKVPTSGTSVFAPITSSASTGTVLTTNFPVDLQIASYRSAAENKYFMDRLRGVSTPGAAISTPILYSTTTDAEVTNGTATRSFDNTSFQMPSLFNGISSVFWSFGRAPGFFDEVCYTGTGAATTRAHNLGVVPELMISKRRSGTAEDWYVYHAAMGAAYYMFLNLTNAKAGPNSGPWNSTAPTSSVFSTGDWYESGATYVTYLFASCPGVSKVGSVTHVEPTTVVCGFTPRFVLIKSTATTGTDDWFVFDSARGITSGNDPYLRLNSTGAENTPFGAADLIDPTADGFIMNGFGGGNYIYLAIA